MSSFPMPSGSTIPTAYAEWRRGQTGVVPDERGYALLLMMIVLVMGSLVAIVGQLDAAPLKFRQAQITGEALKLAREALIIYAATYRDDPNHGSEVFGYLPCPDTIEKTGPFQPGDGTASGNCGSADGVAVGLLPYKTLDLPDLRDADGNCLWYAVSGTFKNSPKPSTPLNWDAQGQLTVIHAGTTLAAPDDANGGAAAIVFAPGPALAGQTRTATSQPCGAHPGETTAYLESVANSFVQGVARDADGDITNNDKLAWISPRDIFSRIVARADFRNAIGTYPEGRINRLGDAARQTLESRLWTYMATLTAAATGAPSGSAAPINQADYTQFAGKLIGDLPDLKPLAGAGISYDNDFDNWQDQFRYVVCADLKPANGCLAVGAQACRGAVLFGGQAKTSAFPFGGPRPAAQKPRVPPPSRSTFLSNYFEAGAGLDLLAGPTLNFTGTSSYTDAARAADVGICLLPGAYASFAKDLAAYTPIVSSAARPEATISLATGTITLGNATATAAGRGCAWLPTPLPFSSSLRAYFKMRIADSGEGFVFAIADGAANQTAMGGGTLCGDNTGSQLGYGGIATPKFGLEIDTRSQTPANCTGSNRNDPGSNHMAFVYWGTAASAADDNCHNAGTLGSSSQPLNPRALTTSTATVQAASWSSNIVTVATVAAHGFAANQVVTITDVMPGGYNATTPIAVIDTTHFAYSLGSNPGTYAAGGKVATVAGIKNVQSSDLHLPYAGSLPLDTDIHVRLDVGKAFAATFVQSATWSATTDSITFATFAPHGLQSNQRVTISGVVPPAYNGTDTISVADSSHFTVARSADPGGYVSGGRITAPSGIAVQTASWAGYAATITTAAAHGFVSGQPVSIAAITPIAYNGTYRVVVVDPTRFSYALGTDPGAYTAGGSITPAVALTLKAYVASNLAVFGSSYISTCSSDDLRNLAADLADLCTQNVSIEQDGIHMNADGADALATIYAGFANAQSSGSAGLQRITISDFVIRTQ